MKTECKHFKEYLKRNKKTILILVAIAIVSYFVKLFTYSISIDTEVTINDVTANDMPWFATGRWALVIIGKFLHFPGRYNYFFSNIIMLVFFVITIILLGYLFSKILKKESFEKKTLVVLGLLILTSPILCEMLNFTMMTAEVAIGIMFVSLSLLFSYIALYEEKKVAYLIAILSLLVAMGIYQAFFPLYIGLIALIFFIEKDNSKKDRKMKEDLFLIMKMVLIFVGAYLGCSLVTKVFEKVYHLIPSGYLTNQITWGKIAFQDSLRNVLGYLQSVILPEKGSLFFHYAYLFLIFISLWHIVKMIKAKGTKALLTVCALLFVLISPFLLVILIGSGAAVRTQMNLPFVSALLFVYYLYYYRKHKKVVVLFTLVIALTSMLQFKNITDLFYSDYIRYQEDKMLIQSVFTKVDMMDGLYDDNREKTTIVFVGMHQPKATGVTSRGDTMSYSFFEWDPATEYASNKRIYGLAKTLGYFYEVPTKEDVKIAQEAMEELEVYPNKNAIQVIDDMVVIRMS